MARSNSLVILMTVVSCGESAPYTQLDDWRWVEVPSIYDINHSRPGVEGVNMLRWGKRERNIAESRNTGFSVSNRNSEPQEWTWEEDRGSNNNKEPRKSSLLDTLGGGEVPLRWTNNVIEIEGRGPAFQGRAGDTVGHQDWRWKENREQFRQSDDREVIIHMKKNLKKNSRLSSVNSR